MNEEWTKKMKELESYIYIDIHEVHFIYVCTCVAGESLLTSDYDFQNFELFRIINHIKWTLETREVHMLLRFN